VLLDGLNSTGVAAVEHQLSAMAGEAADRGWCELRNLRQPPAQISQADLSMSVFR